MTIYIDDVVEGIYALTAMSTITDKATCPLLHPGHRNALDRVVRDSLGILLGMAPAGALTLDAADDTVLRFSLGPGIDETSAAETVRSALCHISVWIICRAGGLTKLEVPNFFLTALTPPDAGNPGDTPAGGDDTQCPTATIAPHW